MIKQQSFKPLARECTVGFELEFSGLTVQQTLDALQQQLQGQGDTGEPQTPTIQQVSLAERTITHEQLGEFGIELDWSYLKKLAKSDAEKTASSSNESIWLAELQRLAEKVVPMEVVCPPLTLTQCEQLLPLTEALRQAGARGTDESWIAAYGVHINTSVPMTEQGDIDANVILRYLQAFGLLQWWLFDAHNVDTTRKVSPYITPYPERYLKHLMMQDSTDWDNLIDDYLQDNATRNRALDMLPLFAHINSEQVRRSVGDDKIKARPTFHYRLPNCDIENPDWNLEQPWHGWWVIEQLANDQQALAEWRQAFLSATRPLIGVNEADWKARLSEWLKNQQWW